MILIWYWRYYVAWRRGRFFVSRSFWLRIQWMPSPIVMGIPA